MDAIALGIMWDRLISITDEIVSTLVRTSFSTIVREAYDLTAVITDADGHLLAQGSWSAPPRRCPAARGSRSRSRGPFRSRSGQPSHCRRRLHGPHR